MTNSPEKETISLLSGATSFITANITSGSSSLSNLCTRKKSTTGRLLSWIPKALKKKPEHISLCDKNSEHFYSLSDEEVSLTAFRRSASPDHSKSKIPMPVSLASTHRKRSEKFLPQTSLIANEGLIPKRVKSERHYSPSKVITHTYSSTPNLICTKTEGDFTSTIQDVMNIIKELQESENHLTHIISKYICDTSVEKELVSILTSHAKLQADAERRACSLSNEMWLQQNEMLKIHESALQENLQSFMKQNRQLQEDLENIKRKNEELSYSSLGKCAGTRDRADRTTEVIDGLRKNNDDLRLKLGGLMKQLAESENDFQALQRKTETLEQTFKATTSQIHTYKCTLHRLQTDNDLERANLSHELQVNQAILKESTEAGDVLLEDLDALKRQLKCTINWTTLKTRGSSLPDLIHICRTCINELVKELTKSEMKSALTEKDMNCLKDEIMRSEKSIQCAKLEIERLNGRLTQITNCDIELKSCEIKRVDLERELDKTKGIVNNLERDLEKGNVSLKISHEEKDKIKKIVIEKDEELALSNEKMCEYKSENESLRMQLHGMKQILTASGSGDVARELAATQEKMAFFQSQYYQLISEKNYLVEQLQTANIERSALSEFQNSYYEFLNVQQQDLEVLNTSNATLKEQLDAERAQILELKTEHNKLKEEKNVMRQIYRQLKSEISKVQALEGEMAGINMEAKRLAIIAEFNKQLGEKLQCEVAERDVKITELQNNVQELNNAQIECNKDKVALCVELTEVCNMNEQLSHSLLAEHQMIETKKKMEDATVAKLQEVEEMQRIERTALRELLKDYNNLVAQRDSLLILQNEYLEQISDLHATAVEHAHNVEVTSMKLLKSEENITQQEKNLYDNRRKIERLEEELHSRDKQKQEQINQLKSEKEELEGSVKYLQTNIRKLHNDLDNIRRLEMEAKQNLSREVFKRDELQAALTENKIYLATSKETQQALTDELQSLKDIYGKFLNDHDEAMTQTSRFKQGAERSMEEARDMLEDSNMEIERLQDIIAEKDYSYSQLKEMCDGLKSQLRNMENTVDDIEDQSRLLSESNLAQARLKQDMAMLRHECEDHLKAILQLSEDKLKLEAQIKSNTKELETNYVCYKGHIEGIVREYNEEKEEMRENLNHLKAKVQELNDCCSTEKASHCKVLEAHKELAAKLLKAVRMLIDEKLNRQAAEANAAKLTECNSELTEQIKAADLCVNNLANELAEMKTELEKTANSKGEIQEALERLKEINEETQTKLQQTAANSDTIKAVSSDKEFQMKELLNKFQAAEERTKALRQDLDKSHRINMELTSEISKLKQNLTVTEFEKCEKSLRLHEIEAKLKSEHNMSAELANVNQLVLTEVLKMNRDGMISRNVSEALVDLIQSKRSGS